MQLLYYTQGSSALKWLRGCLFVEILSIKDQKARQRPNLINEM